MEKLGQLRAEADRDGTWDLIVVDTPPSRSALDFLDAPKRLGSFLDGRFIRLLMAPAKAGGRAYLKVFRVGVNLASATLTEGPRRPDAQRRPDVRRRPRHDVRRLPRARRRHVRPAQGATRPRSSSSPRRSATRCARPPTSSTGSRQRDDAARRASSSTGCRSLGGRGARGARAAAAAEQLEDGRRRRASTWPAHRRRCSGCTPTSPDGEPPARGPRLPLRRVAPRRPGLDRGRAAHRRARPRRAPRGRPAARRLHAGRGAPEPIPAGVADGHRIPGGPTGSRAAAGVPRAGAGWSAPPGARGVRRWRPRRHGLAEDARRPRADVGAPAQQGTALALGHPSPDTELGAVVESVGEALGARPGSPCTRPWRRAAPCPGRRVRPGRCRRSCPAGPSP